MIRDSERNNSSIDNSLDGIFDFVENALVINNDWHFVDSIFESLNFDRWCESELIGFLTITLPFKDKLNKRDRFFSLVKYDLLNFYSEKDVKLILKGLE